MNEFEKKVASIDETLERFWNAVDASPEYLNVAIIPIQLIDEIGILLKSSRDNIIRLKALQEIGKEQRLVENIPDNNLTADKMLDKTQEAPNIIKY